MNLRDIIDRIAGKRGGTSQGDTPSQTMRDYMRKGEDFSVESEISEALADLMLMYSSFPIEGESERARWLDDVSDSFMRTDARKVVTQGFVTGDCIVVPSWNGRGMQNAVIDASSFQIYTRNGDEILSCAYVADSCKRNAETHYLVQSIELVPNGEGYDNVYRTYVVRGSGKEESLAAYPQWSHLEPEWRVPNVERLLIGRFKSFAYDPMNANNAKGAPICFGASQYIRELHYLLDQMHVEFDLSEKAIIASKRMFQKQFRNGETYLELPKGKDRLFTPVRGSSKAESDTIEEWAPEIRYQSYLDAIDKQEKLIERAVGVSSGIISTPNDMNYQNVDNVRKSQQKTIGFISNARKQAEQAWSQLVYAWDILANYYGIVPAGSYAPRFDWSDEYIETFSDKQNAILAGNAIGATDAVDYRMFLYGESPEAAAARVAEIQASRNDLYAMEELAL